MAGEDRAIEPERCVIGRQRVAGMIAEQNQPEIVTALYLLEWRKFSHGHTFLRFMSSLHAKRTVSSGLLLRLRPVQPMNRNRYVRVLPLWSEFDDVTAKLPANAGI